MYLLIGIIIGFIVGYLLPRPFIAAMDGKIPFGHSNCQYPDRALNPEYGCDNSDPARPECMKGGTENCEQVEQIITQPVVTQEPVKDTVNVCN